MEAEESTEPQELHEKHETYVRLVLYRVDETGEYGKPGDILAVMQQLTNGRLIFPGGAFQETDDNLIECLLRELEEESSIPPDVLRHSISDDLFYFAPKLDAGSAADGELRDESYYLLPWDEAYRGIFTSIDPEIARLLWVSLDKLDPQNDPEAKKLYPNVRAAIGEIIERMSSYGNPLV